MDNPYGSLVILLVVLLSAALYFLPTIVAFHRKHHYKWVILAINVAAGASGIGYVAAMIWAFWPKRTGLADPLLNDPTSNSPDTSHAIYARYGANLEAFHVARTGEPLIVFSQNRQLGPYTVQEVRSLLLSGDISQSDLGWREGFADWMPLSAIPEVITGLIPPPPKTSTVS